MNDRISKYEDRGFFAEYLAGQQVEVRSDEDSELWQPGILNHFMDYDGRRVRVQLEDGTYVTIDNVLRIRARQG